MSELDEKIKSLYDQGVSENQIRRVLENNGIVLPNNYFTPPEPEPELKPKPKPELKAEPKTETKPDVTEETPTFLGMSIDEDDDFLRALKTYGPETKELYGGLKVLTGKSIEELGFDGTGVIESGLETMEEAREAIQPFTKETDSFSTVIDEGLGSFFREFLPYYAGKGVAMFGEAALSGIIGGIIGTTVGPGGTVVGGIGGTVAKSLVKKGLKAEIKKIRKQYGYIKARPIVKDLVKREVAKEIATNPALRRQVNKKIGQQSAVNIAIQMLLSCVIIASALNLFI